MSKVRKFIIFTSLLMLGIAMSCNMLASTAQTATEMPVLPTETALPTKTALPTETVPPTKTAIPSVTPTKFIPKPSATPELAPICQGSTSMVAGQCHIPVAEQTNTFCKKKKPYAFILVNKNATYELQGGPVTILGDGTKVIYQTNEDKTVTERVRCSEAGVRDDGRKVVVCEGTTSWYFEIAACDSTCIVASSQSKATHCPLSYYYNDLLGCCTQEIPPPQSNCVTLKLDFIRCSVDCDIYLTEASCGKNSIACIWDDWDKVCQAR